MLLKLVKTGAGITDCNEGMCLHSVHSQHVPHQSTVRDNVEGRRYCMSVCALDKEGEGIKD